MARSLSIITFSIVNLSPAWGQITPTAVTTTHTDGLHTHILGGDQSADGANLFHRFESFNVNPAETVTFVAPATVENILGRIDGGQASTIDGTLAVSTSANLWLLNSSGIVFGPQAHLNLQGDFTAATAEAVGFEQGWFDEGGDYHSLIGAPQRIAFSSHTLETAGIGYLLNLGHLQVSPGQHLRLLGSRVVNQGSLSAGTITIAAVADTGHISLSPTGQLLSLEIQPQAIDNGDLSDGLFKGAASPPIDLPVLLTGQGPNHADTLTLATDGTLQLSQSPSQNPSQSIVTTTPAPGQTTISGSITALDGPITILGDRVSLLNAAINADGQHQGGHIYIGGSYQGAGPLPNATHTYVDSNTTISANALGQGNGGQIVVWADQTTYFGGQAQAQGGALGGNGGSIEISGKSKLGFTGQFSLDAPQGDSGTILFGPDTIRIVGEGTSTEVNVEFELLPEVNATDRDLGTLTLHKNTLEN